MKRAVLAVVSVAVLTLAVGASAQTATLFTNQSAFETASGATVLAIPATNSLPSTPLAASLVDYSCIANTTGIGVPSPSVPDGTEPVLVTAPAASNWICIIGPGWNAGLANTNPTPTSPTIVGNGEDDYLVTFDPPVYAVGFELLTNSSALETVTVTYTDATFDVFGDAVLQTGGNTFEFAGFKSPKPIQSVFVNTTGGASQNEGISGIKTSDCFQVEVDIKPGSDANSISCSSKGVIPVAILTTDEFDASLIDPASVELNGVKAKVVGKKEQVLCHLEDVDGDGDTDMVCQIPTYEFLTECPSEGFGSLRATANGALVCGTDDVRFVPDN